MTDRESHRAAVEAGYASLAEYIEKWESTMVEATQKRYADDVTLQELVRLRVENDNLREALMMWAKFYKNNENENSDNDLFLAEEAMEETRLLLGDDI